ncbi:MAG: hypothetical protein H7X83_07935 [Verrucomicrobia bacterium]|nr:hypothetical protein [Deltaproteobacteria bacterium]
MLSNKHFTQTFLRPPCAFFHVPAKKRLPTVISLKLCRNTLIRFFVVLVIISSVPNLPAYCQESEDSQVFISGFNAYQQKDYTTTIKKMNEVLQKFPDTPLRDMVLFWLARAYYKSGNQQDAARFMSQFSKEYPDNPLKGTIDEELLALTARYDKGEKLPTGSLPATATDRQLVARKAEVEQARLASEKHEKAQRAKDQADRERVAAAKAEAERVAVAAETARLAAVRIAEERASAEAAEQLRLAAVTREEERKAAEKTEQLRVDREKAELERLTALRKEQERIAFVRAEEERRSQEKSAAAKRAVEEAEQQKLASLKAEEGRKASEKLAAERELLEKADNERIVKQQDELVRLALEKTEKKLKAAEKIEEKQSSAEAAARAAKAEQRRLAALKAEDERVAAVAETARLAAAQMELERKATAKAEAEQQALEKAALAKRAAAEAEQQKLALLKLEQERIAAERAEKERLAVAAAEASQQASIKQEQLQRQPVQAVTVVDIAVPAKKGEQRKVQQRKADEKTRAAKAALREKAIAQYKFILATYPDTKSASAAAVKLKELGVAVALPVQAAAAEPSSETAQVLRLEVAQFAGLEFTLLAQPQAYNVAQRVSIPFEITNQGNGSDSFYLESGFPVEFSTGFTSATAPAQAINQTSVLAPGESFKGLIHLTIPAASIDGLRITHPIKASSRTMTDATQSREVRVIAAAPLLRATVKVDRSNPLPGEKIIYRVAVLNVGSTGAQDVAFRLNFPPQLEPVDYTASGFRQEMKAALVIDGLQLKSGESREFSLVFQLRDDSLAGQELLTRAELRNNLLKTTAVFVSTAAYVQPQHGLLVRPGSERLVVIPGQTVSVPFVVTNSGNVREKFTVVSGGKDAQVATIYHDLNRDGVRQANEPVISEVGPLAAKEEASIVMEIPTPRSATDGSEDSARISFRSEGDASRSYAGVTRLVYSRPVLQMAMTGRDGRLKPGEVASFDLAISNRGSNLARIVELQSAWPEQLELVAADPATNSVSNGTILWKFKELGAGEKRVINVSFRVKPGTGMGTNIQVKNILTYEDQIGSRY